MNGKTNDKVKVLTDYECKTCPTWIRQNGIMSTELRCGNKETFRYFNYENFEWIQANFDMQQVDELI